MEAGIGNAGSSGGRRHRQSRESQNQQRVDHDGQCGKLHLAPLDLLAKIFGGTSYHQPTNEYRQDGVQNHIHETHTLAAKDAVEHHVQQRHHAAQRCQCVVHIVDRTCSERCGHRGK